MLIGAERDPTYAKTALGIAQWRPERVAGQLRFPGCGVDLGVPDEWVDWFREAVREYFQLERLWGDAPRLDIEPAWFTDPAVAARHPDVKFHFPGAADQAPPDRET